MYINQYRAATPISDTKGRFHLNRYIACPIISATTIAPHTGTTDPGLLIRRLAITTPNTAFTISRTRNITIMNIDLALAPTTSPVSAPTDLALLRTLAQIAPES